MTDLATMMHRLNPTLAQLQPSSLRTFDEEVSKIPGILKLTLGEPDFDTPEVVKQAGIASIQSNHTHYPQAAGTPVLREAAAAYLNRHYGTSYGPEDLLITVGATEAIWASLGAVLEPGDEVLVPTPAWSLYTSVIRLNGATPVFIDTTKDNYVLTPARLREAFAAHPQAKAIIINYPNNPTGQTMTEVQLAAIAEELAQHPVFVISDEVYSGLTYGVRHVSLATWLPEQTLTLNGVSKSHAMTGWRIGMIAGPTALIKQVFKFHQASVTSAAYPMQDAALAALTLGEQATADMRAAYHKRGAYLYQALTAMGVEAVEPKGAFYLFCKVPDWWAGDDVAFCHELAYQAKVAVIAASAFGPGGANHFRISYAAGLETLKEAVARMQGFFAAHQNEN